jgi:hypothetical protein
LAQAQYFFIFIFLFFYFYRKMNRRNRPGTDSANIWVNHAVGWGNIPLCLIACWKEGVGGLVHPLTPFLLGAAVAVSTLMHLSERKHRLPGVPPFRGLTAECLAADRIVAVVAAIFVASRIFASPASVAVRVWVRGVAGLAALALSEHIEAGPLWFATLHSVWHYCAYATLVAVG